MHSGPVRAPAIKLMNGHINGTGIKSHRPTVASGTEAQLIGMTGGRLTLFDILV